MHCPMLVALAMQLLQAVLVQTQAIAASPASEAPLCVEGSDGCTSRGEAAGLVSRPQLPDEVSLLQVHMSSDSRDLKHKGKDKEDEDHHHHHNHGHQHGKKDGDAVGGDKENPEKKNEGWGAAKKHADKSLLLDGDTSSRVAQVRANSPLAYRPSVSPKGVEAVKSTFDQQSSDGGLLLHSSANMESMIAKLRRSEAASTLSDSKRLAEDSRTLWTTYVRADLPVATPFGAQNRDRVILYDWKSVAPRIAQTKASYTKLKDSNVQLNMWSDDVGSPPLKSSEKAAADNPAATEPEFKETLTAMVEAFKERLETEMPSKTDGREYQSTRGWNEVRSFWPAAESVVGIALVCPLLDEKQRPEVLEEMLEEWYSAGGVHCISEEILTALCSQELQGWPVYRYSYRLFPSDHEENFDHAGLYIESEEEFNKAKEQFSTKIGARLEYVGSCPQ